MANKTNKSGIVGLAKKSINSKTIKKPTTKSTIDVNIDDINDIKINKNKTVNEIDTTVSNVLENIALLEDITENKLNKNKSEEITENVTVVIDDLKKLAYTEESVQWLKDEIKTLHDENNKLRELLNNNKMGVMFNDDPYIETENETRILKEKILQLFFELNDHYANLKENFIINPPNFIARLIKFFPFLEQHRRF